MGGGKDESSGLDDSAHLQGVDHHRQSISFTSEYILHQMQCYKKFWLA